MSDAGATLTLSGIRDRLASYRPEAAGSGGDAHAAVALVLQSGSQGPEFVAIHRSHRAGDPWAGHIALPGGRQHRADADLLATAARETREEIGIDLGQDGDYAGGLDELRAVGRGRLLNLVITPCVYLLRRPVSLTLDAREVQSAFWVPLEFLRTEAARGSLEYMVEGQSMTHPAFVFQGYTIWGLTYRILTNFLSIVAA